MAAALEVLNRKIILLFKLRRGRHSPTRDLAYRVDSRHEHVHAHVDRDHRIVFLVQQHRFQNAFRLIVVCGVLFRIFQLDVDMLFKDSVKTTSLKVLFLTSFLNTWIRDLLDHDF